MLSFYQRAFFCCLVFALALPLSGWAKEDPFKLGKVTEAQLKMTVYDKDTSAAAVVLHDQGESSFLFTRGTQVLFKRIMRIKILKKSGLDQADIVIPFYKKSFESKEEVLNLKGFTYNLEGGKVVKVKLEEQAIFEEKQDVNWYAKKLTMPNVKVGSVIEVAYEIKSDFIENLREWEFQSTIPVLWSEYQVNMVPFFEYTPLTTGFNQFHIKDAKVVNVTTAIAWEEKVGYLNEEKRGSMSMQVVEYRWVMKDLPAFVQEPYLGSMGDYLSKMEFMLTKIQYPDQEPRYMAGNWEGLARELQKEEQFGGQLLSTPFLQKTAATLVANAPDNLTKVKTILAYVQKQMDWDGKNRVFSENLKKAHDKGTGSSADINLLLTALLREGGVDAKPMLVSTRQHGKPVTQSPMLSKFNYVISHVTVEGTSYLLDATDASLPFGMLPFRCLNEQGWVVEMPAGKWVPLKNSERNAQVVAAQIEIKPTGELAGAFEDSYHGMVALQMRSAINENGQDSYTKKFTETGRDYQRQALSIQNLENLQEPLKTKYTLNKAGDSQPAQLIYLSPMLSHTVGDNPFKIAERLYPVDFATPVDEVYTFSYKIPEGYAVEELPKSTTLTLAQNSAKFTYVVQETNGKIEVLSRLSINKAMFSPQEYANLRELYSRLVAKHAEKIVLKKKS
ncbi:DUF3857 domain-containing protein [Rufibacter sp. LB8]|uniref:DUF3857 domain-containing protein n=1 Tax=Rufibacter sp. LB8 TaxID=2777781 RepID=UPI00178C7BDC|nr:DUF3857 domain-containing protein [Rufibacter sp. LB8]